MIWNKLPLPPAKWAQFVDQLESCSDRIREVGGLLPYTLPHPLASKLCTRTILERMGYDIGTIDRVIKFFRDQRRHEMN